MHDTQFLDFDEAVRFLKTNPSTLYKWLQSGKVPGHKLGRQWRFLRDELEKHISGGRTAANAEIEKEISNLVESLSGQKRHRVPALPVEFIKTLIWRVYDSGFYGVLHFRPDADGYQIICRNHEETKPLANISSALFRAIDMEVMRTFQPGATEESRRIFLSREKSECAQAVYQKVNTIMGIYATYKIFPAQERLVAKLEDICSSADARKKMQELAERRQGIIVITGPSGAGKTTTAYALLRHIANQGKIIFTLEDNALSPIAGVNHVELTSMSIAAFEREAAQVNAIGADVTAYLLDPFPGPETALYAAAAANAQKGHLVIVQSTAPSPEVALESLCKNLPSGLKHLVVGVIFQTLVAQDKGWVPSYAFLDV